MIFGLKSDICPISKNFSQRYSAEEIKSLYSDNENHNSIAAGFFGMKRDSALFEKRIEIFAKLLRFLILQKDTFIFGIDEVILKLVLAVEPGTMNITQEIPHQSISFNDSAELVLKTFTNTQILKRLTQINNILKMGRKFSRCINATAEKANPKEHHFNLLIFK